MTENAVLNNPFRLISTQAIEVMMKSTKTDLIPSDYNLNFNHQVFPPEGSDRLFIVEFTASVTNTAKTFILNTKFHVRFQTDHEISPEYLQSNAIKINAPAIAFPFLRSFITTLTANAGFPPVILPPINFVRLLNPTEQIQPKA